MIKELRNISLNELDELLKEGFEVYEKLDMYYFRVEVTKVGAIPLKGSTENVISDIDCITNKMFKDICNFVEENINPLRNEIISKYGEIRLGFFYNPEFTYHIIKYDEEFRSAFMLSDIYSRDRNINNFNVLEEIRINIIKNYNIDAPIYQAPKLRSCPPHLCSVEMRTKLLDYINGSINSLDMIRYLVNTSYTGHIENMEGIVIRSVGLNKGLYQIILNDVSSTQIDKNTKLIYRDTVLKSFVNTIANYTILNNINVEDIFKHSNTYIDRISDLFICYIEHTSLFNKYSFDPEDLLPPHIGYIGDVDLDIIPNQNVKILCMHNEVNKNIFRLLLHTFSRNISENKFSSFSDDDKIFLNNLMILLQYKNYKQIMYTAYKANNM